MDVSNNAWPKPSSRYREYVDKVRACGHWEFSHIDGKSHAVITHTATNQTAAYALHDGGSERNAPRNFATQAGRVCGCSFVEARGRKRSRKAPQLSGYSPRKSLTERETAEEVDALQDELADLRGRFERCLAKKSRNDVLTARRLQGRMSEVKERLADLHQPIPCWDWDVIA